MLYLKAFSKAPITNKTCYKIERQLEWEENFSVSKSKPVNMKFALDSKQIS
jgi:hypothetical protein